MAGAVTPVLTAGVWTTKAGSLSLFSGAGNNILTYPYALGAAQLPANYPCVVMAAYIPVDTIPSSIVATYAGLPCQTFVLSGPTGTGGATNDLLLVVICRVTPADVFVGDSFVVTLAGTNNIGPGEIPALLALSAGVALNVDPTKAIVVENAFAASPSTTLAVPGIPAPNGSFVFGVAGYNTYPVMNTPAGYTNEFNNPASSSGITVAWAPIGSTTPSEAFDWTTSGSTVSGFYGMTFLLPFFGSDYVGGQGDITDPGAWTDSTGAIPPAVYSAVPENINYPLSGDGRYWFTGNNSVAFPGPITFIGNPALLIGTMGLSYNVLQPAGDQSDLVLSYSLNGGATWVAATIAPTVQDGGLISGTIPVALTGATGIQIKFSALGGVVNAAALPWEVALSITRNLVPMVWDTPNPFDPVNYNSEAIDAPNYDSLSTLQNRMLIRLGFANQLATPPPGMPALLQEFLQSAQNFLYRRFMALRTKRFFRWKVNPGQRFYGLLDNDEDILRGYTLDQDKSIDWVGIQDSRNVWYPLVEGIDPTLYTMITKPWRPARYEIRQNIELFPAPDQTYWLWIRGHFGLQSFVNPDDQTTIDSELVFLHALATAKAHYGQADANNVEAMANAFRAELCASTHKTSRYIPGTRQIPPAIRPSLLQFDNE